MAFLFENGCIYTSEWREVVLLLSGILYKQGKSKINHLIDEIIARESGELTEKSNEKTTKVKLPFLAKKVSLLGAIVRDLSHYNFEPSNPEYTKILHEVMGIFEKETFRSIPVELRIQAADALGQAGDPRFEDDPMVRIPGGKFWMGAQKMDPHSRNYDPEADEGTWTESPVHQVELSPYSISKYPITVCQFQKFIENGGYNDKKHWETGGFGKFKEPDHWEEQLQYPSRPVVYLSWYESAAYAHWAGGRLPTEAEWERAAHGHSEEYRKYPWGNKEPDKETANFNDTGINKATPVGIFPESCSLEEVIDLAGNVFEWCWDWHRDDYYKSCYEQGIIKDPKGPEKGVGRVLRGGCFGDNRLDDVGFRVVRLLTS